MLYLSHKKALIVRKSDTGSAKFGAIVAHAGLIANVFIPQKHTRLGLGPEGGVGRQQVSAPLGAVLRQVLVESLAVEFAFPSRYDHRGDAIADHVDHGAEHAHEAVNAQD